MQRALVSKPREKLISEESVNLPDGEYDGLWSGYSLDILRQGADCITIKTTDGVRGVNCLTDLLIRDERVYEVW